MKTSKLGIPYMGSKRKLQPKILEHIKKHNPNQEYFIDMFGGGAQVSLCALENNLFKDVHYNELNTQVVNLLRKIQQGGVTEEFYEFISREEFFELIKGSDWKSGLQMTCWSFGNNQNDYLFGKKIEEKKKIIHNFILESKNAEIFNSVFDMNVDLSEYQDYSVNDRRKILQKILSQIVQNSPTKIEKLKDVQGVNGTVWGIQEQLQRIHHLVNIQELKHLEQIKIHNFNYSDFPLENFNPENTILYCDIPYENTANYKEKSFNHKEFYEFCNNSKFKIYVSSYESPLEEVLSVEHISILSATNNSKKVQEKLFCNQPESIIESSLGDW